MHVLDKGVSIIVYFLQRYSTQNYLECVGTLQDHYDTLEDIKSDLQTKGPLAEDIEGLHCQLEEVQVCRLQNIKFHFTEILLTHRPQILQFFASAFCLHGYLCCTLLHVPFILSLFFTVLSFCSSTTPTHSVSSLWKHRLLLSLTCLQQI